MTNACLPWRLRKTYAVLWAANYFLVWNYLKTMLLTNFENLNSVLGIFHETHDYLVSSDSVIICIYIKTNSRHFSDQGNVISKLLKCDLIQTLNNFWNPSLQIFAAGILSLVLIVSGCSQMDMDDFRQVYSWFYRDCGYLWVVLGGGEWFRVIPDDFEWMVLAGCKRFRMVYCLSTYIN